MRKFNHIAALIKSKRLSHPQGLSQSDLSHLLGYKNGQFISNVERALCNIPFKMMNKVCDILHITPDEISTAMLHDYRDTINSYFETNQGFANPMNSNPSNPMTTNHTGFATNNTNYNFMNNTNNTNNNPVNNVHTNTFSNENTNNTF